MYRVKVENYWKRNNQAKYRYLKTLPPQPHCATGCHRDTLAFTNCEKHWLSELQMTQAFCKPLYIGIRGECPQQTFTISEQNQFLSLNILERDPREQFNSLHVLFYSFHKSRLCSSSRPPSCLPLPTSASLFPLHYIVLDTAPLWFLWTCPNHFSLTFLALSPNHLTCSDVLIPDSVHPGCFQKHLELLTPSTWKPSPFFFIIPAVPLESLSFSCTCCSQTPFFSFPRPSDNPLHSLPCSHTFTTPRRCLPALVHVLH